MSGLVSSEILIWDNSSINNLNLEHFPLTVSIKYYFSRGKEKAIRKSQLINMLKSQF